MAQHNDLGKQGELEAIKFLRGLKHIILATNYRHGRAEIDIISKDGNTIVFTEVKTRSTEKFGYPEESVDSKKMELLKQAAEEYIYENNFDSEVRFDIISLTPDNGKLRVHHIKDAFFFSEEE